MSVELKVKTGQTPVTSITIVAKGDNPEELTNIDTRNAVLAFARANGLPTASGLNNLPSAFPVDENGDCDEKVITGKTKFSHYEAEYTVNAGLR